MMLSFNIYKTGSCVGSLHFLMEPSGQESKCEYSTLPLEPVTICSVFISYVSQFESAFGINKYNLPM